uniref:Uncharacterized protein n=1 Tax=Varanus komodoensis TaxID=61221 RepID=A0A8D2JB11_VARKO
PEKGAFIWAIVLFLGNCYTSSIQYRDGPMGPYRNELSNNHNNFKSFFSPLQRLVNKKGIPICANPQMSWVKKAMTVLPHKMNSS